MKMSDTGHSELSYSRHARIRQHERNINDRTVDRTVEIGDKMVTPAGLVFTDENTKVVLSHNSTVITVVENMRNKQFDLSEKTEKKARRLLNKVRQNNTHAMCELAELYLNGDLGEQNAIKACKLYEQAAELGSSHAMVKLSTIHEEGILGKKNQELSDIWMRKAADKKNVYALAITGQRLLEKYIERYPVGTKPPTPNAYKSEILNYFNAAASKGATRAIWHLGYIYEHGLLGNKDLSKAIKLYVSAAKNGSPMSVKSLDSLAKYSKFDIMKLEEILDHLALKLPKTSIGMAVELGIEQVSEYIGRNPIRGLKMIEQAALKGVIEGIKFLAVNNDLKLAQYWYFELQKIYKSSSEGGNIISLWKLGKLYLNGKIGEINLEIAESCFIQSVEKSKDSEKLFALGKLYLRGKLGNKPMTVAKQYMEKAFEKWKQDATFDNKTSYSALARAYCSLNSHKNSIHWLNKCDESKLEMAKICLDDLSSERNIPLGIKLLEDSILLNNHNPKNAFQEVGLVLSTEILSSFQRIASNISQPTPEPNTNKFQLQELVLHILANTYAEGKLVEADHNLACKYYYQLFVDFKKISAGISLIELLNNDLIPNEITDTLKTWAVQFPKLLEDNNIYFDECLTLLCGIYNNGLILTCNSSEANIWIYLHCYMSEDRLVNLPGLDSVQIEEIVRELTEIANNIKIIAPTNFKIISRILGDIVYKNKNIDKAIYWYTESSLKNNSLSSFNLGKIYQHDKEDLNLSIYWYKLSAQQGYKQSIEVLKSISCYQHLDDISSFLSRYEHQSIIDDTKLANIKPLRNLERLPVSHEDMYAQGKFYLSSSVKNQTNLLNAAYWFRKGKEAGSIDAAIELFSMYKSGMLGNYLVPVADSIVIDILSMCCYKLKKAVLNDDVSSVLPLLLNYLSLILGADNITFKKLKVILEKFTNKRDIQNESVASIISILRILKEEFYSNSLDCEIVNATLFDEVCTSLNHFDPWGV